MSRTLTTWMLGGLLALAGTSWAQGVPPAGEEKKTKVKTAGDTTQVTTTTTTTDSSGHTHHTVERSEVKTWTMDIDGSHKKQVTTAIGYDGASATT